MTKEIFFLLITFLFNVTITKATIKLPALVSDGMVLQQKTKVKLWGSADRLKKVSVTATWSKNRYAVSSGADGKWQLEIETPKAGGPFSITISDGVPVKLNNILIGEVWFCSGQSNMDMPLSGYMGQPVNGALEAVTESKKTDQIRFFNVERAYSTKVQEECKGKWRETSFSTLTDCSAVAYFFARKLQKALDVPVAIIVSSWGGSQIEAWMDEQTLKQQFPEVSLKILEKKIEEIKNPRPEPALLFNSMVNPVLKYGIKGFLWYQGESNRFNPELYRRLFPEMVKSWRHQWQNDDLPFYYIQIAPYNYSHPDSLEAANLRQVQRESLDIIPNSGMVVTADVGHPTSIHPPQKNVVGNRLALLALAKTYQQAIPFSGPLYKSVTRSKDGIVLKFDYADRGLHSSTEKISGFELAGTDKIFYPATASLNKDATSIILFCKEVQNPSFARYAYRNYAPVDLFNNWNLPLCPFTAKIE